MKEAATMTPTETETVPTDRTSRIAWVTVAETLLPTFAARAAGHDDDDTFVAAHFRDPRPQRVFCVARPTPPRAVVGPQPRRARRRRRLARGDVRGAPHPGAWLLVDGAGVRHA